MRQLAPEVVQTGRLKSGAAYRRGFDEIAQRRRGQVLRLDRVDVLKYEVMFQGIEGGQATFGVRYSMDFFWRDRSVERERNTNECYKVRQVPDEDRWVIVRNDDYQQRICYR